MTVAVLVNVKSRHGSTAVGERIRSILPEARVAVTSSLSEARAWVKDEIVGNRPTILLSGGGDGTAIALLNELREQGIEVPTFGLLGLGTGNGWARATGGVGKRAVFRDLRAILPRVKKDGLVLVHDTNHPTFPYLKYAVTLALWATGTRYEKMSLPYGCGLCVVRVRSSRRGVGAADVAWRKNDAA